MSKRIMAAAFVAALSLTACGERQEENVAIDNVEDLNMTEDLNMDLNADMNADMNMDMNADMNATDNASANAMDNTTNSY